MLYPCCPTLDTAAPRTENAGVVGYLGALGPVLSGVAFTIHRDLTHLLRFLPYFDNFSVLLATQFSRKPE